MAAAEAEQQASARAEAAAEAEARAEAEAAREAAAAAHAEAAEVLPPPARLFWTGCAPLKNVKIR